MGPIRAGIYCRISDDQAGKALGVARQEKDCRAIAAERGWDIHDLYVDNDLSASQYARKPRPSYDRLTHDIKAGALQAVIVWDLDRLVRQPRQLEEFVELCDAAGIRHLATVGGTIDLGTGDGLLIARIKGAVAAEEARKTSQRIKRKLLEIAEAGNPHGAATRRTFGYELGGKIILPDEAQAIRDAATAYLAGDRPETIARRWNQAGFRTPTGLTFSGGEVRRILTSERRAGLRIHNGTIIGPSAVPAILERDTWERVVAAFAERAQGHNPRHASMLAGLIRCATCDQVMYRDVGTEHVNPKKRRQARFICKRNEGRPDACGHMSIRALPLEEMLLDLAFEYFDSHTFICAIQAANPPAPATPPIDLADLDRRATQAAEMFAAGETDRAGYLTMRRRVETERAAALRLLALRRPIEPIAEFLGTTGALASRWDGLSVERRRAILGTLIDRVTITPIDTWPPNAYTRDRVTITWRY